ncbi:hypothetical protein D3C71_1824780 [compost metagenome]
MGNLAEIDGIRLGQKQEENHRQRDKHNQKKINVPYAPDEGPKLIQRTFAADCMVIELEDLIHQEGASAGIQHTQPEQQNHPVAEAPDEPTLEMHSLHPRLF